VSRKKKADNPEQSQETPARETTELHVPEAGLIEETAKEQNNESNFKDEKREAIFAKRREQIERENASIEASAVEPIIDNAVEESVPETLEVVSPPSEPVAAKSDPTTASPPEQDLPPEKFPINVNGQIVEYTIDELKQQAQLGVGAREKFNEAARMREDAQRLMFASQQHSQPLAQNNQQVQPQEVDIPEKELRDIAKRLNYGSEDEQVKALKEAGILFSKTAVQPNQLTPEVLVDVATRNAINVITAQQEQDILKSEFKDIVSDPALAYATDFMANQLTQKYSALGQQKTRLELLREAGNMARERYLKPALASSQSNSSASSAPIIADMANKVERKRAAPQPPNSANKVASDESQPYGIPSIQALDAARKKAFSDIANRRGQKA